MDKKLKQELKNRLDEESYHVIVDKGTEHPHSGQYNLHFDNGVYRCKACGENLFLSDNKFENSCGWPSFDKSSSNNNILMLDDNSLGIKRTEIICAACQAHLGHVFDDGPTDTGLRYCVNSCSLEFSDTII